MKCHLIAWGHPHKPDIDIECDSSETRALVAGYPCVSEALLEPISVRDLQAAIEEMGPTSIFRVRRGRRDQKLTPR